MKTANSGYLTRRLVDVAQDVIVREKDCGTDRGLTISAITEGNEMIEPLYDRIVGRYALKTVFDPQTGDVIVPADTMIDEDDADKIDAAGVEKVTIRSAFTCNTVHGVCEKCYGRNMATGDEVEVGEAVGTVAAQSIGEPGTQLTMRNFHTGGVAGNADITQGLPPRFKKSLKLETLKVKRKSLKLLVRLNLLKKIQPKELKRLPLKVKPILGLTLFQSLLE
ncbi:hypothetical protein [Lentilactobacillus senioris]|uniref:hypothetical protein n=1 Tax=Lentilactobacillus senioris TaxID=931534 RepID=UPI000AEB39D1|nr:hypothetical protein [Lentilactobacillus senioris]